MSCDGIATAVKALGGVQAARGWIPAASLTHWPQGCASAPQEMLASGLATVLLTQSNSTMPCLCERTTRREDYEGSAVAQWPSTCI